MMQLRRWYCTAGHLALSVLEAETHHDYANPPCPVDGCTMPTVERVPTEETP